jgi:hypothetical protein
MKNKKYPFYLDEHFLNDVKDLIDCVKGNKFTMPLVIERLELRIDENEKILTKQKNNLPAGSCGASIIPVAGLKNVEVGDFMETLENIRLEQKQLFGLVYDNENNYLLSGCGRLYSFMVHYHCQHYDPKNLKRGYEFSFSVWTQTGTHRLFGQSFIPTKDGKFPKELINAIYDTLDEYENGKFRCNDCGQWMTQQEVGGQYFAGRYCKNCWENKGWKNAEAKETYE